MGTAALPLVDLLRQVFDVCRTQGHFPPPLRPETYQRQGERRLGEVLPSLLYQELKGQLSGRDVSLSALGDHLVAHLHWRSQRDPGAPSVYLGHESWVILQKTGGILAEFLGIESLGRLRGIDLGCGAGGLSIGLSSRVKEMVGVDTCLRAVEWATANGLAQAIGNLHFESLTIGDREAEVRFLTTHPLGFDFAVSNPPMVIPEDGSPRAFRDGGIFGIEWPLRFLLFAEKSLRPGGLAIFLLSEPFVQGRSALREKLEPFRRRGFDLQKRIVIDPHFNRELYEDIGVIGTKTGIENVVLTVQVFQKASGNWLTANAFRFMLGCF